jgi:hypothetical protein
MQSRTFLLAAVLLTSCAGALSQGESQFDSGNYPAAKQTFASLETDSRTWDDRQRAEYALYRGLTLGALGDREYAGPWLRQARAIEEAHPGSLSPEYVPRLRVGLETNDVSDR